MLSFKEFFGPNGLESSCSLEESLAEARAWLERHPQIKVINSESFVKIVEPNALLLNGLRLWYLD